jgi:hypothetical protein
LIDDNFDLPGKLPRNRKREKILGGSSNAEAFLRVMEFCKDLVDLGELTTSCDNLTSSHKMLLICC